MKRVRATGPRATGPPRATDSGSGLDLLAWRDYEEPLQPSCLGNFEEPLQPSCLRNKNIGFIDSVQKSVKKALGL